MHKYVSYGHHILSKNTYVNRFKSGHDYLPDVPNITQNLVYLGTSNMEIL